jgi:CRISPR/Cas system-associated exonuclease Cas4 (RecB family)
MGAFKNEMGWSRTRVGTLHDCRRRYYYQYYHKWGGWNWNAPEDVKKTYFLTKLNSLPALVGDAVHRTIKKLLEQKIQYGHFTLEDPALYARKELLSRQWLDSVAEKWRSSLKHHPPMFETYYEELPSKERLKDLGTKTTRCIDTFLKSALAQELQTEDHRGWLAVDPDLNEAPELRFEGRKVYAIPDFARRTADGTVEIWDWKTGKPGEHDELQLLSYALYAQKHWMVGPEKIRLFAFYLDPDIVSEGIKEYEATDASFERIRSVIRDDFALMDGLLTDKSENVPMDADPHFPMIEDGYRCRYCNFKELCAR